MKKFPILFIIASFSLTSIARSISDIQQDGAYLRGYDENEFPKMLSHEAQGLPDTFIGSIGIYKITMQTRLSKFLIKSGCIPCFRSLLVWKW